MVERILAGGCLCGAVRYQCSMPIYPPSFCHCTSCRRASGAHVVAWFTVQASSFFYRQGEPATYQSSPPVRRSFCSRCGAQLAYAHAQSPDEIDVAIGSLDDPGAVRPAAHIWMQDAAQWDQPADGLPQFQRSRRSG